MQISNCAAAVIWNGDLPYPLSPKTDSFVSGSIGYDATSPVQGSYPMSYSVPERGVVYLDRAPKSSHQLYGLLEAKPEQTPSSEGALDLDSTAPVMRDVEMIQRILAFSPEDKNYLTAEQMDHLLTEQLVRFYLEFGSKVPHTQLAGIIRPGEGSLQMCGSDLRDVCANAATMAGPNTREAAELCGMQRAYDGLVHGDKSVSIHVSPSYVADYMFVMVFVKGPYDSKINAYPVQEVLLRLPEQMGELDTSQQVYDMLSDRMGISDSYASHWTEQHFLASPLVGDNLSVDAIMQSLGVGKEDIEYSHACEQAFRKEFHPYIQQYIQAIYQLSEFSEGDTRFQQLKVRAETLRDGMFVWAQQIAEQIRAGTYQSEAVGGPAVAHLVQDRGGGGYDNPDMYYARMEHFAAQGAHIVGGTSCPSTVAAMGGAASSVQNMLAAGMTMDQAIHALMAGGENPALAQERKNRLGWKWKPKEKCPFFGVETWMGPCGVSFLVQVLLFDEPSRLRFDYNVPQAAWAQVRQCKGMARDARRRLESA